MSTNRFGGASTAKVHVDVEVCLIKDTIAS